MDLRLPLVKRGLWVVLEGCWVERFPSVESFDGPLPGTIGWFLPGALRTGGFRVSGQDCGSVIVPLIEGTDVDSVDGRSLLRCDLVVD